MSTYNNNALYEIIQKELIEKIEKGVYKTGDRLPSEKELSDTYQVSRITSAKALSELSLGGYIHRIQGKGSFVNPLGSHMTPNTFRQNPYSHNTDSHKKIGLIIPEHADYHSGNIILGITETLQFPDFFLNTIINRQGNMEDYALKFLLESGYEGIILFPTDCEYYSDTILKMHLNKFPFVLIDRMFPGIHSNFVITNNDMGCKAAIDHFISIGHTNIAFVSDSSYKEQITSSRYESYLRSMSHYKLPIFSYEHFFGETDRCDTHTEFLHNVASRKITAVLTSNSHVAVRLYTLCLENNIRIPEDLSIICFDNPNLKKESFLDFFTYVDQNSYEMGKQAGLILKNSFLESANTEYSQIILEPKLMINHSTQSFGNIKE